MEIKTRTVLWYNAGKDKEKNKMLLINKTLINLAKGCWKWIILIVLIRFFTLLGITRFAEIIGSFLGSFFDAKMNMETFWSAVVSAFLMTVLMVSSQLVQGELEYRCTRDARKKLRRLIFSKVLDLDVGHIETIGPVSAITSSVDAVEQMQVYFSSYLPSLLFSVIAPFYLFVRMRRTSLVIASLLLGVSLVLLPLNNLFRNRIESMRSVYWESLEDMTSYYLDSIRGLTTFKLFGQSAERAKVLDEKAQKLNRDINAFQKVNFTSFLLTEGLIYAAIILSVVIACGQLQKGVLPVSSVLTILLLSYSFFSSIRTLMNTTHSALTAVAAAGKLEEIMNVDTSRPYDPDLLPQKTVFSGIEMEHVSFRYPGRKETLKDISIKIKKGTVTALAGLSGSGKSTIASLLMRFSDPEEGVIYLEGKNVFSMTPDEVRKQIVMVPQSVTVFSGTIRENLLIAKQDASEEELWEALELSALAGFARSLENGLDSDTGKTGRVFPAAKNRRSALQEHFSSMRNT